MDVVANVLVTNNFPTNFVGEIAGYAKSMGKFTDGEIHAALW